MKKALTLVILLLLISAFAMFVFQTDTKENKPYIAVTSFNLYEITHRLIGKNIEVKKLIPYGVEAHSFMPSPKTMAQISKAELFIFNGLGMEPWIKKEYKNQIDMSKSVTVHSCDDGHHHHNSEDKDPHYWLDMANMSKMTSNISMELVKKFPQYKQEIQDNTFNLVLEFTELSAKYNKTLKTCKKKEIVVNHNAFEYLAHKYDFHVHSVTGLSADEQPSAKKMNEITSLVKEENIKIIFFESFVSSKVSDTIAKETGAKVLSLYTLANVTEAESKEGYSALMEKNLEKLSIAMECE